MSRYYEKVGAVSNRLRAQMIVISHGIDYQISKGDNTDYAASFEGEPTLKELSELTDLWPVDIWQSAFFMRLKPGGFVHRHTDVAHPWNTYHIVLLTNEQAINSMYDPDGTEHPFQLEAGGIYFVDRNCEHGSVNNGSAERLHLLMEVYDA